MRPWLSAAEIAEAVLPGLPTTKSAVIRVAERDGWSRHRERAGRGGGREYHIDCLPRAARLALFARLVPAAKAVQVSAGPATAQQEARLTVLRLFRDFEGLGGMSRTLAVARFVEIWNSGHIEPDGWLREALPHLSVRTIARWLAAKRNGEVQRLSVDRGAARRGTGLLDKADDGRVRTVLLGFHVAQPHLTTKHLRSLLATRYPHGLPVDGRMEPLPPLRTLQHALKVWLAAEAVPLASITNPDQFKARHRLAGRNSYAWVSTPNQLWMIDASPADVLLLDGRHSIYLAIDVATRRLLIHVTKTPRSAAVQLLMRQAVLAWGCPDAVKTDNGADFVARDTQRLFEALEIEALTSRPFSPEEKAFVERAIGTFQRDLCPLLPGFVGHDVSDRKAIEERRSFAQRLGEDDASTFKVELTRAELQAYCDQWCQKNAQEPHAGLAGRTPFAVTAASTRPIRTVAERALDVLLMPVAGTRTATKSGIRVDHIHYLCGAVLPGTEVLVRMDPTDLGRVHLFSPDGLEYLGEGVAPEHSGIDPARFVALQRQVQAEHIQSRVGAIRDEARRIAKGPRLVDLYLRREAEADGKLVSFPARREAHTTPQIDAALMVGAPPPTARPLTPDQVRMAAAVAADLAGAAPPAAAPVARLPESPEARFRRARALERAIAAGEPVAADQALWLGRYQTTAEYRSMAAIAEDFGLEGSGSA